MKFKDLLLQQVGPVWVPNMHPLGPIKSLQTTLQGVPLQFHGGEEILHALKSKTPKEMNSLHLFSAPPVN